MSIAFIAICPIGSIDHRILSRLAGRIEVRCGVPCKIHETTENPQYAFDERRGQYDSKLILGRLLRFGPPEAFRLLGITHVDLFVPILRYVFGVAEVGGRSSLISLHRLRPEFYDQPADHDLLMQRAEKTALHEIGHSIGLVHCRDRRCVMFSSTQVDSTDFKQAAFCPTCFDLFRWAVEREMPGRAR